MEYWKVEWHHDFTEEPTVLFSEIGDDGYETRKVQVYRDGRILKADEEHEHALIGLSEIPVGDIADVAAQAEFSAWVISKSDFYKVWDQADWPESATRS